VAANIISKTSKEAHVMVKLSYLPGFVKVLFKGMPGVWKHRHLLVLDWLVLLQAVVPGRKTIRELSRRSPAHITEWRLRRLLKASYWTVQHLIAWWAEEAMSAFPPPQDGCCIWWGTRAKHPNGGRKTR
jgi:hypothetical protein